MPTEELRFTPGQIAEGKVQGITNFGAFIELAPGIVGLVHISEIADTYVKDVKDFLKESEIVKVKILNVDGKKLGLSIKQAQPKSENSIQKPDIPRGVGRSFGHDQNFYDNGSKHPKEGNFDREWRRDPRPNDQTHSFNVRKPAESVPVTLDDKIARFLKESDERMQPLKARYEHKKRSRVN